MWHDRWFAIGRRGAVLSCLACPVAVLALGAIGLGAPTGHLDLVLLPVLLAFVALAFYRYWLGRRATR